MDGRPAAVLGIDLGTSQVKALLCARDGSVLGQGAGWLSGQHAPARLGRGRCRAVVARHAYRGPLGGRSRPG